MAAKVAQCCRGCLTELNPNEVHSFQWTEIRQLFEDCTNLTVPTDEVHLPQNLCSGCYTKCEQWHSFRRMCHDIDKFIRSSLCPKEPEQAQHPQIKIEIESDDEEPNMANDTLDWGALNFGELVEDPAPVDRTEQTDASLNHRSLEVDDDGDSWHCPVCSLKIPVAIPVKDHMKEHYSESEPRCPICHELFNRYSKVFPHILSHHMSDTENYHKSQPADYSGASTLELHDESSAIITEDKTCPLCSVQTESLYFHLCEEHVNPGDKECPLCEKSFSYISAIKVHLAVHTNERPFACDICKKSFKTKDKLLKHLKRGVHDEPKSCPVCQKMVPSVFLHLALDHTEQGSLMCPLCDRICNDRTNLQIHLAKHAPNEKPFDCRVCRKPFASVYNVAPHMTNLHPEAPKETTIETCERVLRGHNHQQRNEDQLQIEKVPNSCPICSKPVSSVYSHLLNKHSKKGDKTCPICCKEFEKYSRLKVHLVVHTDERPFACDQCDATFTQKYALNTHLKNHSTTTDRLDPEVKWEVLSDEEMGYEEEEEQQQPVNDTLDGNNNNPAISEYKSCPLCLEQVPSLFGHLKASHVNSGDLDCPICKKSFCLTTALRTHLIVHTGEKPFQCKLCDATFTQSSSHRLHVRRTHRMSNDSDLTLTISGSYSSTIPKKPLNHSIAEEGKMKKEEKEKSDLKEVTTDEDESDADDSTSEAEETRATCPICSKSVRSIYFHTRRAHVDSSTRNCPICDWSFTCSSHVKKHLVTHTDEYPYACKLCGTQFRGVRTLKQHVQRVHRRKAGLPLSKICKKIRGSRSGKRMVMRLKKKGIVLKNSEENYEGDKQCPLCPKKVSSLYFHLTKTHIGAGDRKCPICYKEFSKFYRVKRHLVTHTDERPFKCTSCSAEYSCNDVLVQHIAKVHDFNKSFEINQKTSIQQVMADKKSDTKEATTDEDEPDDEDSPNAEKSCPICYKSVRSLFYHMRRAHVADNDKKCPICAKVFGSSGQLRIHLVTHTDEHPYGCKLCGSLFSRISAINKHVKIFHPKMAGLPFSKLCKTIRGKNMEEKFLKKMKTVKYRKPKRDRGKEKRVANETEENIKCPVCSKCVRSLHFHLLEAHVPIGEELACPICSKRCRNKSHLQYHIVLHTDEKPFKCQVCDESYSHAQALKRHIEGKHPNEKVSINEIYKRAGCSTGSVSRGKTKRKKKQRKVSIEDEIAPDSDPKPAEEQSEVLKTCPICPKKVRSLYFHLQEAHVQWGTKTCPVCGIVPDGLRAHLINHSEQEQPYVCKTCGLKYTQAHTLKSHIEKNHPERMAELADTDRKKCGHCKKLYHSVLEYEAHIAHHGGESKELNACTVCGVRYQLASHLRNHMQKQHSSSGVKTITLGSSHGQSAGDGLRCSKCSRSFASYSALRRHQIRAHKMGELTHQCKKCKKGFTSLDLLLKHSTIHKAGYGYSCSVCEQKFSQIGNLKRHQRRFHQDS